VRRVSKVMKLVHIRGENVRIGKDWKLLWICCAYPKKVYSIHIPKDYPLDKVMDEADVICLAWYKLIQIYPSGLATITHRFPTLHDELVLEFMDACKRAGLDTDTCVSFLEQMDGELLEAKGLIKPVEEGK